ncbi:MAG: heavy-metal-associated domain-containing protein [Bacteroidia bacterium]
MKSITRTVLGLALMFSLSNCSQQLKNAETAEVKIYGNCGMCQETIEKAGNVDNEAVVKWNKDTKMATIKYDKSKTSEEAILKRIAAAGYDSDAFKASDEAYNGLHECCQYKRPGSETESHDEHMHANDSMPIEHNHADDHMHDGEHPHSH